MIELDVDTIFELEKKVNRVVFRKSSVTPIAGGRRERERERARASRNTKDNQGHVAQC